jgi:hypothetical protein
LDQFHGETGKFNIKMERDDRSRGPVIAKLLELTREPSEAEERRVGLLKSARKTHFMLD